MSSSRTIRNRKTIHCASGNVNTPIRKKTDSKSYKKKQEIIRQSQPVEYEEWEEMVNGNTREIIEFETKNKRRTMKIDILYAEIAKKLLDYALEDETHRDFFKRILRHLDRTVVKILMYGTILEISSSGKSSFADLSDSQKLEYLKSSVAEIKSSPLLETVWRREKILSLPIKSRYPLNLRQRALLRRLGCSEPQATR